MNSIEEVNAKLQIECIKHMIFKTMDTKLSILVQLSVLQKIPNNDFVQCIEDISEKEIE